MLCIADWGLLTVLGHAGVDVMEIMAESHLVHMNVDVLVCLVLAW